MVWFRREAMVRWPLCFGIVRAAAHVAPQWSRLPTGAAAHGQKLMKEQVFGQDLWPLGDPHRSSPFLKDCTLSKGFTMEQFVENGRQWEGPTMENFRNRVL